jgi:hypothetical protein
MPLQLPTVKDVRDLFEDTLGRSITVSPTNPLLVQNTANMLVSVYVDEKLKLGAVVGMNFPLTVYAGAAIGLLPPGGAKEAVAARIIPPPVAENIQEVCNIMTILLNREGAGHLRLYKVYMPGEIVPSDASSALLALGRRIDLTVAVGGYGEGRLAISLVG